MAEEMLGCYNIFDLRDIALKRVPKGLLHPQDAKNASDCGADGVIVSNHGGCNLDGTPSPMQVLPEMLDAVGKRMTVLIDSGFRRGGDVVKALALGAHGVQIGRSTLYGVAAGSEVGPRRAIGIFREEIDRVLALLGCRDVAELGLEFLHIEDGLFRTATAPCANIRLVESAKVAAL
jgi:isopentenyl diphosphate isomerase/L-lactate dehydrogenase-like FMN-dependent dehydrogenase